MLKSQRWHLTFFVLLSISINALAQPADTLPSNLQQLLETGRCPGCNLRGADLAHQNLAGANLEFADLTAANLTETNLRGANLSHAILLNATLIDTKLSGANLTNADLSDLDIDESFESMEIIGTQLEGASFKDGVICGPAPDKGGWGCQHQ
jgi:uncharacterized protein YjbI with pentapeptide repeats